MVDIKIEGLAELKKALLGMPDKLMVGTISPATKASTNIVAQDMKRRAPVRDKGWIRKSIKVYSDKGKQFRKGRRFNPRDYVSFITGPLANVVPAGWHSKYNVPIVGKQASTRGGKLSLGKIRPYWAYFFEYGRTGGYSIKAKEPRKMLATRASYSELGSRRLMGGAYNIRGYHNVKYFRKAMKSNRFGQNSAWIFFGREVRGGSFPMHPFVRPAFHTNISNIIDKMKVELDKGVKKAMKVA